MGNTSTKESRPGDAASSSRRQSVVGDPSTHAPSASHAPRSRRSSRADLGMLGLGSSRDRERQDAPFERRETRQEREARRLERERAARLKERERSMREEHVDGGYLVTLGTYTGTEDFSKPVVRQLQLERKIAPFWRGLNDWSDNWAEHQLVAAARGLDIPAADAPPDPDLVPPPPPAESSSSQAIQNLTVPMGPRTMSAASDKSASGVSTPAGQGQGKSSPFKPRAKALAAALSIPGSRNASSTDLAPKEIHLANDPYVNGQMLEVFLYKDASECPICFLTYPPYLNRTRCCDQPICSECFVQIKRSDPHLPEHHPDGEARDPNETLNPEDPPEMLISEPAACPYCQQPEFGVTYDSPSFRRGLAYSSSTSNLPGATAMSSQTSLNSTLGPGSPPQTGRRRTHSLSATAPNVITTDRVRPDWATKLASARAHQARRAAAATALHTAAFLVGGNEQRSILRPSRFSRRSTRENTGSSSAGAAAAPVSGDGQAETASALDPAAQAATGDNPRGPRRSRMDELEDMMFMEAVRLSLAAEEDRKRKEEKAYRKDAKKRLKEERKAQKKQSKDPYSGGTSGASASSLSLGLGRRRGNSGASNLRMETTLSGASNSPRSTGTHSPKEAESKEGEESHGKGKAVDRGESSEDAAAAGSAPFGSLPIPTGSSSRGGSHLRQMSNASSLGSSVADTPSGSYVGQEFHGPDGKNPRASGISLGDRSEDGDRDTGSEPMWNFRSLAEMVGVNIEDGTAHRDDGEDEEPYGGIAGRPLSQVKEDEKEDAEAEHVEGPSPPVQETSAEGEEKGEAAGKAVEKSDETKEESRKHDDIPTPELMVTPDTPAALEGAAAESKRLGDQSVTEHPSSQQITQ